VAPGLAIGDVAPDFTLPDASGDPLTSWRFALVHELSLDRVFVHQPVT